MYEDDPDAPEPFDLDDDDRDESIVCPECGAAVYDQADYCNKCGNWITPVSSKPKLDLKRPYRNTKLIVLILLLTPLIPAIIYWAIYFLS